MRDGSAGPKVGNAVARSELDLRRLGERQWGRGGGRGECEFESGLRRRRAPPPASAARQAPARPAGARHALVVGVAGARQARREGLLEHDGAIGAGRPQPVVHVEGRDKGPAVPRRRRARKGPEPARARRRRGRGVELQAAVARRQRRAARPDGVHVRRQPRRAVQRDGVRRVGGDVHGDVHGGGGGGGGGRGQRGERAARCHSHRGLATRPKGGDAARGAAGAGGGASCAARREKR